MKIDGEFTIYTATLWKDRLLQALETAADLDLDLSAVSEFDSAGLQLLMLARRETLARGQAMRLQAPSRCVMENLQLCRVTDHFTITSLDGDSTDGAA